MLFGIHCIVTALLVLLERSPRGEQSRCSGLRLAWPAAEPWPAPETSSSSAETLPSSQPAREQREYYSVNPTTNDNTVEVPRGVIGIRHITLQICCTHVVHISLLSSPLSFHPSLHPSSLTSEGAPITSMIKPSWSGTVLPGGVSDGQ